ncbi:hypothetical protein VOLCADRAFT_87209 [Volvox carteri f. nagariensis]|uniref:Uncharacterized protein n=1 Tax=Volvox carteri f. nagariensis TaxID=3068 RepID=D8TKG3_VOLCA|nr:uncharacterized protein VOLCADRAFT_87209 [Volvox carteri f. nagariensis]EFJ52058.1 hypothetical protein VOLCADRAFT_87209 [Volvox carteri f. nagariensis]|eukprot:XP_002946832.1 hypothetical protein VOLCADRAFT_87209 [Volvox carteri f. nagariensis]
MHKKCLGSMKQPDLLAELLRATVLTDEDAAHFWAMGIGLRLHGPHGAAAICAAHPLQGWVCDGGTADTTSLLNDSQANRDRAEHVDPSCGTGKRLPMWARDSLSVAAPTDIRALRALMKSASPNGGGRNRAGSGTAVSKALIFKQKLLLSSYSLHDEAALFRSYTNAEFNAELERGRQHHAVFESNYGSKPATTVPYNITKRIHDGDMPDFNTAMYADIMKLWITASQYSHTAHI